jgi:hypothetical protein
MEHTYDPQRQNEWKIGENTINMAAVLHNIVIRGDPARSAFLQTAEQIKAVKNFAKYLPNNTNWSAPSRWIPAPAAAPNISKQTKQQPGPWKKSIKNLKAPNEPLPQNKEGLRAPDGRIRG